MLFKTWKQRLPGWNSLKYHLTKAEPLQTASNAWNVKFSKLKKLLQNCKNYGQQLHPPPQVHCCHKSYKMHLPTPIERRTKKRKSQV
jgi:hypothetical protein